MAELIGTDGNTYTVRYKQKLNTNSSKLHLTARELINKKFPLNVIIEEFAVPGNVKLFIDFFIPEQSIVVEIQGEQHYKFNTFFYKNKYDFVKAKFRDAVKLDFCKQNNFLLIELSFNDVENWGNIIDERRNSRYKFD